VSREFRIHRDRGTGDLKRTGYRVMGYSSLREQPTQKLRNIYSSVDELLSYSEALPTELHIKLDTLRADIAAILEDRQDLEGAGAGE
jgi:hypothetical protein